MTITSKAVFAALLLTLTPALASAQGNFITNYGPGVGGAPGIGAIINPGYLPSPINGGQPIPMPVQADACGASYLQVLVGYSVDAVPLPPGTFVRGPNSTGGIVYDPTQLTVMYDYQRTIARVFCG
ncbi:MAG TPA: hypothetical protein EYP31_07620 [Roseibacterium sp.]|nr:hypothetical protein [Roseibacterium sp.]